MNLKYNCAPVPTLLPDPLSASMTIVATVWPLANDDPEILGRFFFFFEKWRDGFSVALLSPEWLGAFFFAFVVSRRQCSQPARYGLHTADVGATRILQYLHLPVASA